LGKPVKETQNVERALEQERGNKRQPAGSEVTPQLSSAAIATTGM
jgi:hypothetical protein